MEFPKARGGLKHGSRPWLGMDIFWNCPFPNFVEFRDTAPLKLGNLPSLKVICPKRVKILLHNVAKFYRGLNGEGHRTSLPPYKRL